MVPCPTCAEDNQARARFCSGCGNPLPTPGGDTRKTVTIMFCDITGSTGIGEKIDSEPLQQVMTRFFTSVREVIQAHGGTVEKFIGDAVFAVFGIPVLHEDDALRAVRAALDIREAMDTLNSDLRRDWGFGLRVRIGINSGEVTAAGRSSNRRRRERRLPAREGGSTRRDPHRRGDVPVGTAGGHRETGRSTGRRRQVRTVARPPGGRPHRPERGSGEPGGDARVRRAGDRAQPGAAAACRTPSRRSWRNVAATCSPCSARPVSGSHAWSGNSATPRRTGRRC